MPGKIVKPKQAVFMVGYNISIHRLLEKAAKPNPDFGEFQIL